MIQNDKFVPLHPSPPHLPNHPYHGSSPHDNNWNLPQLSSPKVSQFYHSINQFYLTSSNSPSKKRLKQLSDESQIRSSLLNSHKASAKRRLTARKIERTELEKYCKNSSGSPLPSLTHVIRASQSNTPSFSSSFELTKYEFLPKTAKKKVVTEKIASIQLSSFYSIMNKTQELMKLEKWKKDLVKKEVAEQRKRIRVKHERGKGVVGRVRVLEEEQKDVFCESSFGFYRRHKTGKLFERLSRPKERELYSLEKSDLRGVLTGQTQISKDRVSNRVGCRRSSM